MASRLFRFTAQRAVSQPPSHASCPLSLHVGHLWAQLYPDASLSSPPYLSLRAGPPGLVQYILPFSLLLLTHLSGVSVSPNKEREGERKNRGQRGGRKTREGGERERSTSVQPPAAGGEDTDKPRPSAPALTLNSTPALPPPAPPPRRTAGRVEIRTPPPPPPPPPRQLPRRPARPPGGHVPRCG